MEIIVRILKYTHILDYQNFPFRCARFYIYGHILRDCDKPFQNNFMRKDEVAGSSCLGKDPSGLLYSWDHSVVKEPGHPLVKPIGNIGPCSYFEIPSVTL